MPLRTTSQAWDTQPTLVSLLLAICCPVLTSVQAKERGGGRTPDAAWQGIRYNPGRPPTTARRRELECNSVRHLPTRVCGLQCCLPFSPTDQSGRVSTQWHFHHIHLLSTCGSAGFSRIRQQGGTAEGPDSVL